MWHLDVQQKAHLVGSQLAVSGFLPPGAVLPNAGAAKSGLKCTPSRVSRGTHEQLDQFANPPKARGQES